jgi:hypothetical protein
LRLALIAAEKHERRASQDEIDRRPFMELMELVKSIKGAGVSVVGFLALLSMTAGAQETRSEVSVQGTGFFTDLLRV